MFYWAALAGSGNRQADNIMKHGTNNILILLDIVLSRVPFVSYHFWVRCWAHCLACRDMCMIYAHA